MKIVVVRNPRGKAILSWFGPYSDDETADQERERVASMLKNVEVSVVEVVATAEEPQIL